MKMGAHTPVMKRFRINANRSEAQHIRTLRIARIHLPKLKFQGAVKKSTEAGTTA
jgi:hypothetical protein